MRKENSACVCVIYEVYGDKLVHRDTYVPVSDTPAISGLQICAKACDGKSAPVLCCPGTD